jgi:hypothetical protein
LEFTSDNMVVDRAWDLSPIQAEEL